MMNRMFVRSLIGLLLAGGLAACADNGNSVAPSPEPTGSASATAQSASPAASAAEAESSAAAPTESATEPGAGQSPPVPANAEVVPALEPAFGERTFERPVAMEIRADKPGVLYVVEQPGRIVGVSGGERTVVLDIADRVNDGGMEQGLLGLAFNPQAPGQAFVNYTTESHTVISRFDPDSGDSGLLDPDSEQVVLTFEQPYDNHNGGQLAFGPDGYLYIATGDGGSGGDPHNNGQKLDTLLGKILRIDVNKSEGGKAYAIPADNPLIDRGAPEIYAYGLRNPWRFSFDGPTGELWAADVGQNQFEEINVIEAGKNYGWKIREGFECFSPRQGCESDRLEQPVFAYGRSEGVSVTGGYVYRGSLLPELTGWYVYGDYGSGKLWALKRGDNGEKAVNKLLLETEKNITSFGRDAEGELYLSNQDGEVLKLVRSD